MNAMIKRLQKAREAYELGCNLQQAIERGRRLHTWINRLHSMAALREEVDELRDAIKTGNETHIRAEAIDVAVVALRIEEGR